MRRHKLKLLTTIWMAAAETRGVFAANLETKSGEYYMDYTILPRDDFSVSVIHNGSYRERIRILEQTIRRFPQAKNSAQAQERLEQSRCDQGVARIILKRFANAGAREDYWQKRMNVIGNVVTDIGNCKCFSQNLGQ